MQTINQLVRKHTAFKGMKEMLKAEANYRPTLNCMKKPHHRYATKKDVITKNQEHKEIEIIADAYDALQTRRGDNRRAYRI